MALSENLRGLEFVGLVWGPNQSSKNKGREDKEQDTVLIVGSKNGVVCLIMNYVVVKFMDIKVDSLITMIKFNHNLVIGNAKGILRLFSF